MKKFSLFTIITVLAVLFVVPAILASLIKMIPSGDQPGYGDMGRVSVYGIRTFGQVFISKNKNLTAIGTTIKNPNLKNQKDVLFNLYDDSNRLVRTVRLNGFNIGDGDFVKIIFDVIPDSEGKKYNFVLSSPDANEEEILELFLINPTDTILSYSYGDEVKSGGIPMVTFHKPDGKLDTIKKVFFNLFSKL